MESEGTRTGALSPQGQCSGNLLMLAQTALSYCEDISYEEEDDYFSQGGVRDCETLVHTDKGAMLTNDHMSRPTALSSLRIHLSECPYRPRMLIRAPPTSCKLMVEDRSTQTVFYQPTLPIATSRGFTGELTMQRRVISSKYPPHDQFARCQKVQESRTAKLAQSIYFKSKNG